MLPVVIVFAVLAVLFFGAGFAIHVLWVIAVIAALLWVISYFAHHTLR